MESMEVFMGTPNERVVAGATRMPPRRWSGDETNFRRCLYKSDLVSRRYHQRCNAGPQRVLSIRRTSGFPRPLCPLVEWPFEIELKRGSIFIRRFLMKHLKCMKPTVVSSRGRTSPLLHSQSFPLCNLRLLPIVTPQPRYLPYV